MAQNLTDEERRRLRELLGDPTLVEGSPAAGNGESNPNTGEKKTDLKSGLEKSFRAAVGQNQVQGQQIATDLAGRLEGLPGFQKSGQDLSDLVGQGQPGAATLMNRVYGQTARGFGYSPGAMRTDAFILGQAGSGSLQELAAKRAAILASLGVQDPGGGAQLPPGNAPGGGGGGGNVGGGDPGGGNVGGGGGFPGGFPGFEFPPLPPLPPSNVGGGGFGFDPGFGGGFDPGFFDFPPPPPYEFPSGGFGGETSSTPGMFDPGDGHGPRPSDPQAQAQWRLDRFGPQALDDYERNLLGINSFGGTQTAGRGGEGPAPVPARSGSSIPLSPPRNIPVDGGGARPAPVPGSNVNNSWVATAARRVADTVSGRGGRGGVFGGVSNIINSVLPRANSNNPFGAPVPLNRRMPSAQPRPVAPPPVNTSRPPPQQSFPMNRPMPSATPRPTGGRTPSSFNPEPIDFRPRPAAQPRPSAPPPPPPAPSWQAPPSRPPPPTVNPRNWNPEPMDWRPPPRAAPPPPPPPPPPRPVARPVGGGGGRAPSGRAPLRML